VWHVAVFGDDLEALNRFRIADDIVQIDRTVLFDPCRRVSRGDEIGRCTTVNYQGSS